MAAENRLKEFTQQWLPALEGEMRATLASREDAVAQHYAMMHYHMGWVDADLKPSNLPAGKRVRMRGKLKSARQRAGGLQVILENTIEIEGEAKPACTAETLVLYFFES